MDKNEKEVDKKKKKKEEVECSGCWDGLLEMYEDEI